MPCARTLALSALLTLAAASWCAAEPPPRTWWGARELPRQWTAGVPESGAVRQPDVITRDEQVQTVSLKEAIALALENNPRIAARRLEPMRLREGVLGAQAIFDPTVAGEVMQNHSITPNASSLAGQRTLKIDDRVANFHLFKTFRTGTIGTIDFLNERLDNNARFQQLRPEYSPALNLSIVQPLLRNFGWDFTYLVVRVAEQTADAALFQYQADLADFVTEVIQAYWNVVRARDTLEVQRESLGLAVRTVDENQARVKVGLLPPVATLEAQADAKLREEQVLIAENTLALTRQQLAQLAYYRPDATFVPRTLEPIEEAAPEEIAVDLDQTLSTALAARAEIQASARGVEVQQLNEKIAGNALLPRLDLVGGYGVNGLSGQNRAVLREGTTFTTIPIGRNCVQIRPDPDPLFACTVAALAPRSDFAGSRQEAYDRLVSNDFKTYSFGLQFQVPLSNAGARSDYAQSRISRGQAELGHRELLSSVTLEVRQTVSDVLTTRQRIDTTRVARELAEENQRNQQKRHEVGMATTKDLLDFQTRLTTARASEVAAKIEHAIAVARWRRARGEILSHYQIVVEHPARHSPPWFARF
jgi:outer membrane protein TolC